MSYMSKKAMVVLCLSGQLLVACSSSEPATTTPSVVTTPTAVNASVSKLYTNTKFSYQLNYPSNASLTDTGTSQIAINLAGYPDHSGYISITAQPISEFAEYLSYRSFNERIMNGKKVYQKKEIGTANTWFTTTVFISPKYFYEIQFSDGESPNSPYENELNAILDSFQFIK